MRLSKSLVWLLPLLLIPAGWVLADWTGRNSAGVAITFDAFSPGGQVLPKHAIVDSTGINPAAVSGTGALKADITGTTLPVTQSGTWNVNLSAALPTGVNTIGNVGQAGAPWSMNLTQIGGANISAANPVPTQLSLSSVPVAAGNPFPVTCIVGCTSTLSDSAFVTYAAGSGVTLSANATGDLSCLPGSVSKTVRVRKVEVATQATSSVNAPSTLVKRSTANTGGTSTTLAAVRHDTTDPTATTAPVVYTAMSSSGVLVGNISALPLYVGGVPAVRLVLEFGNSIRGDKSIVVRGTNESVCVYQASTVGTNYWVTWEWTEE